ncbi:MAG: endolytic transglycosylase MltG [Oscillospiraceae bacterium]|nr:endolytic transglycosylase MltG [Oscillospiraceae bacterium]
MDNEKLNGQPDRWFDDLMHTPETGAEIGADEQAVASYDMADLSDIELEKIIQEAMAEQWDMDDDILPAPEAPSYPDNEYTDTDGEATPAEAEEYDYEETVARKVRPKRKGGYGLFGLPHLLSTAIWAGLILFIGISLGRVLWLCAADILAFGRQDKAVTITITDADNLDSITNKLYNAGLIEYPELFKMYAKLAKVEEKDKISAGTFELNTLYDYHALVGGMSATSSYRETIEVFIPEGYTCAQIYALLEEKGVCTVQQMEEYASQSEFSSYWFLEGVERGSKYCLEGFLFPDTYEFYTGDKPQRVFHKLLSRFDDQFTDEMVAQIDTLNQRLAAKYRSHGLGQDYIDQHKMTVKEIVIIASMIEKETAHTGEIRNISSVIYNRLTNPGNYPTLDIDATLLYYLGKSELTDADLADASNPYNTRIHKGLPPGPISNPGLFSLKAALDPADTNYYFYALDPNAYPREHKFFTNYDDHKAFLASLGY